MPPKLVAVDVVQKEAKLVLSNCGISSKDALARRVVMRDLMRGVARPATRLLLGEYMRKQSIWLASFSNALVFWPPAASVL